MKFKKFLVVVLFVVSFVPVLSLAKSYSVSTKLDEGIFMVPTYDIVHTDLTYEKGIAYIVLDTEGDCRTQPVRRCRDYSAGRHYDPFFQDCWIDFELACNHQTGYYPLPADAVIFDGKTRLKFIRDGQYQTIARWDRLPFFPFVRELNVRRENVKIGVSKDLKEATLFIETDN
ncbi:MAG: hypothetical protein HYY62_08170 [Deltaproteobacteria bacterium]|nr:hypothetical protein [Deltaproteobacteria bacterium]